MSNNPPRPVRVFIITATRTGWRLNGAGCEDSITIAMDAGQRVRFEIEPEPAPSPPPYEAPAYILVGRADSTPQFRVPVVLNTFLPKPLPAGEYDLLYLFREGLLGGEIRGTLNVGTGGAEEDDGLQIQPQTETTTSTPQ